MSQIALHEFLDRTERDEGRYRSAERRPSEIFRPNRRSGREGQTYLVRCLEAEGVDTIFAYPGGASMELHQALTR